MTKCGHLWYNIPGSNERSRQQKKKKKKYLLVWLVLKCQNLHGTSKSFFLYRLLTQTCWFIAVTILTLFFCKYFFCTRVMSWLDSVTRIRFMVFAKGFFLKRYPPRPVSSLRFPYLYFIITLSCYFVNTFFYFLFFYLNLL